MVQPLYKAKRPLFSCEIMMSVVAQIRKSLTEHTEPASPPKSGHDADIAVDPSWAMCGRLRVGKENLHVAGRVGAAMCSAFWCGSHDRWP